MISPKGAILSALLLLSGCATAPAKPSPPTLAAPSGRADEAAALTRRDLDQAARRLDAFASKSDDFENALARLGVRLEALERRVDNLAALLAHGRASSSPSTAGGGTAPNLPPSRAQAPRSIAPGRFSQSPRIDSPGSGASATSPEDLYQAGVAKFQTKELDAAALILYDFLASYPRHPLRESAQFLVADILFVQKDLRSALKEFEELLAEVPNGSKTAETLLKIGLCQRGLGDDASARRSWERLVKEYPDSSAARQARVLLRGPRRR